MQPVKRTRKIIVHIATSADGFIARPDGNIEWLTARTAPKGFYGIGEFMQTIDAKVIGRKTYEVSVALGAKFDTKTPTYVFSHGPPPKKLPPGVEFVADGIEGFVERLRGAKGRNVWLMGGGEIIAAFLDAGAIDDFIVSVIPTFIGEGIPLMAHRHRDVPLRLRSVQKFSDGVAQLHYAVRPS
jgi:dihydrofolate reductase